MESCVGICEKFGYASTWFQEYGQVGEIHSIGSLTGKSLSPTRYNLYWDDHCQLLVDFWSDDSYTAIEYHITESGKYGFYRSLYKDIDGTEHWKTCPGKKD